MSSTGALLRLTVLTITLTLVLSAPLQLPVSATQDEPTWTFMVYMAADSEPELPWEEDLNEMESADLAEWMDVVVLADPLGDNDSILLEIRSDDTSVVTSPLIEDSGAVIPAGGEVDMSSPDTLYSFMSFAVQRYPADRYALVLWGHGGGWYGLCADGTTIMSLNGLGQALQAAAETIGRNLDIVIADSCAQGVLETIYEVRRGADWYVGSEINIPAQGLRYDLVLSALAEDATVSPGDFGATVCDIHRTTLYYDSWSAAMAAYDLSSVDQFARELEGLASYVQGFDGLHGEDLLDILNDTARSDFTAWYLDVGDILQRLVSSGLPIQLRYQALQTLLSYHSLIYGFALYASPYDDDMTGNYTGAVAYAPGDTWVDERYWSLSFASVGWGDAMAKVRDFAPDADNLPGPQLSYDDTDGDGRQDEATLEWEAGHDTYYATAFVRTPSGFQRVAEFESSAPEIVIDGVWGDLLVSASAWDAGTIVSNHELDITLNHDVEVRVQVFSEGQPVSDGVDVLIATMNGTVQSDSVGGEFVCEVRVPEDAAYGELVTVQVTGAGGHLLGENRTFIQGSEVVVRVDVMQELAPGPEVPVLVVAVVLIIAALAVAAVLIDMRRGGAR